MGAPTRKGCGAAPDFKFPRRPRIALRYRWETLNNLDKLPVSMNLKSLEFLHATRQRVPTSEHLPPYTMMYRGGGSIVAHHKMAKSDFIVACCAITHATWFVEEREYVPIMFCFHLHFREYNRIDKYINIKIYV